MPDRGKIPSVEADQAGFATDPEIAIGGLRNGVEWSFRESLFDPPPGTDVLRHRASRIYCAGRMNQAKRCKGGDTAMDLKRRIAKLEKTCPAVIAEFESISSHPGIGAVRMLFQSALTRAHAELGRVAKENGVG